MYTTYVIISLSNANKQIEIHGLVPDTQYWFMLQIFRMDKEEKQGGGRSNAVQVVTETRFGKPGSPHQVPASFQGGSPASPSNKVHKHVSTAAIVINLIVVVVLIGVGVGLGLYFYRKRSRWGGSGDSAGGSAGGASLSEIQRRRMEGNDCFGSKIGIIDEIEENSYEN